MTEYWRVIQRRLHEESLLHYPRNVVRKILKAYIDGTLNKLDEDERLFFEQGFLLTCIGNYLDERGAEMGVFRKPGKIATGTAVFHLAEEAVSTIVIPRGTLISNNETDYEYVTTDPATISKGETSVTIGIQAISYGAKYNTTERTITFIETASISKSVSVYNNIAVTGGADGETDDEYRKRLFNLISTNLSVNFLKKQGIILYSKKKYNDNIRTKMSSLNPYLNNEYCAIPPNDSVLDFVLKEIIYYRIMQVYIKGWK